MSLIIEKDYSSIHRKSNHHPGRVSHKAIINKSKLSTFSFMDCGFVVVSKKPSPNLRSSRFSLLLSSSHFIVLHFTLRSVDTF